MGKQRCPGLLKEAPDILHQSLSDNLRVLASAIQTSIASLLGILREARPRAGLVGILGQPLREVLLHHLHVGHLDLARRDQITNGHLHNRQLAVLGSRSTVSIEEPLRGIAENSLGVAVKNLLELSIRFLDLLEKRRQRVLVFSGVLRIELHLQGIEVDSTVSSLDHRDIVNLHCRVSLVSFNA